MNRGFCERLVIECEQVGEMMGMDFYETMKKAPIVVERWKFYFQGAQQVWQNANNREEAIRFLENLPEPKPENFEKVLAFLDSTADWRIHKSLHAPCNGSGHRRFTSGALREALA